MTAKGGPKTVKGKLISSQNSLKHGLTSSLLSDSEQAKHQMLQKAFFEEHSPKTITEELLVSDLAMIRVRLERFDEVEISLFKRAAFDAQLARNIVKDMQLNDEDIHRNSVVILSMTLLELLCFFTKPNYYFYILIFVTT